MKKLILTTLIAGLLFGYACDTHKKDSLSNQNIETIKSEIQVLLKQIIEDASEVNHEKVMEYYSDQPDFISISNGIKSDYTEFHELCKNNYESSKNQIIDNSETIIEVLDAETVLVTLGGKAQVNLKNDDQIKVEPFSITLLFKKMNGAWKITYTHESGNHVYVENDTSTN
ncbi:nuclear transport factor 2 family protein [Marinifilum fragile]|uniref:nuclear transport factor 2 family protein n=1 Tax=Marinifilum fragile TaxID=570161 RepID=UPI002AA6AC23|nr:nuclear transport factor 2 family protein [Marinifilum fragile]